jgi:hypothetical protein
MNTEYKTIAFADVKIGQEFEFKSDLEYDGSALEFTTRPWTKSLVDEPGLKITEEYIASRGLTVHLDGCLVRTADCEPVLDFDTWWKREKHERASINLSTGAISSSIYVYIEATAKAAWDAAKAK